MIVITGATGQLGSLIVASLLERIPAEEVGVSVRDPGRAADLAERGVRVRRGDFGEPDSLADAFEGATQVLIVSANELGGKAVDGHAAAIDAARAAGAERILYTSHQGAGADSLFAPIRKVNYTVTNARVGQQTDYDKLTLEVWTNGSIKPQDAVSATMS